MYNVLEVLLGFLKFFLKIYIFVLKQFHISLYKLKEKVKQFFYYSGFKKRVTNGDTGIVFQMSHAGTMEYKQIFKISKVTSNLKFGNIIVCVLAIFIIRTKKNINMKRRWKQTFHLNNCVRARKSLESGIYFSLKIWTLILEIKKIFLNFPII